MDPWSIGRGDWIRTSDIPLPKRTLYQAEPRPDPVPPKRPARRQTETILTGSNVPVFQGSKVRFEAFWLQA